MHKVQEVIVNWDFWVTKYTEDFKTQKLKFIKLTYLLIIIFFLEFGNNEHQHVCKIWFEFHTKIVNNFQATVYRIAIPLDSKNAILKFV